MTRTAAALLALLTAQSSLAQGEGDERRSQRLVATCAPCHAVSGDTARGRSAQARTAGAERWLRERLAAYREGRRPATLMHQLVGAYSDEELDLVAQHLAKSRR